MKAEGRRNEEGMGGNSLSLYCVTFNVILVADIRIHK